MKMGEMSIVCPECHVAILELRLVQVGSEVWKCPICGYTEVIERKRPKYDN